MSDKKDCSSQVSDKKAERLERISEERLKRLGFHKPKKGPAPVRPTY